MQPPHWPADTVGAAAVCTAAAVCIGAAGVRTLVVALRRSGSAQFAQGGFRGDHNHHGFRRGLGFVAGLAAGSALGYGYYDSYPYDNYAYNDYYDGGYSDGYVVSSPGYVVSGGGASDPAYCAQRYRSYDPATGTYLGYDGLRHPCE